MAGFDFDELEAEEIKTAPVFVGWYSGGFRKERGAELLKPLMTAVSKQYNQIDTLVLHFPNEYGMFEEGSDPWPAYVDKLVEEIDSDPTRTGRPLLLFGHSRGCTPAMSVAARLGSRVWKIYLCASNAPEHGKPSPFQALSETFKEQGDLGMLGWFVSLDPNPMMVAIYEQVKDGTMKIESNEFVNDMLTLMRAQYKDAMFPDMTRDFEGICAPILGFRPDQDVTVKRLDMERWKEWTTARDQSRIRTVVNGTHMNCLSVQMIDGQEEAGMINEILKDIGKVIAEHA
mmetsp:Transcript_16162/g.34971  ORF Transcript_16162/g.34971 Transcript_16162/m.34971 type:complete len:287 (-) Transcript_16162:81-941(-)